MPITLKFAAFAVAFFWLGIVCLAQAFSPKASKRPGWIAFIAVIHGTVFLVASIVMTVGSIAYLIDWLEGPTS